MIRVKLVGMTNDNVKGGLDEEKSARDTLLHFFAVKIKRLRD